MDDERKVPKGHLGRLARLAAMGVKTGAGALLDRSGAGSANHAAEVLGTLRGLAAKVGQMASYVDGLVPEAQRETYGDELAELHPYMWAVKQHYYNTNRSYYNYPYMFGQLFGLGLYARYQQNPEEFKRGYDALLSSTGMADAATLAARFDIDLRDEKFWRTSLDVIRGDIARFDALSSKTAIQK